MGIIPAGAGHFTLASRTLLGARDHPRRCGALIKRPEAITPNQGSSRQVRGTYTPAG